VRRLFGVALSMVLFLLWERRVGLAINHAFSTSVSSDDPNVVAGPIPAIYWLVRESLWWALISMLVALIIALLSRAPLAAEFANLLLKRNSLHAVTPRAQRGD
jgi:hypothetical protein